MCLYSNSKSDRWREICYDSAAIKESPLEPERVGKYELIKFLGGGMSRVYMARDTLIGRTVAVKILTDSGADDADTKARFIREAQLAGNVIHDNIIRVYDFGEESGRLFMVMEFLEGEDLNDAIRRGHTGAIENRLVLAIQIARAMEHVHSLQIVHRDLKPHNVYVTKEGIAKLMDFGIAKTDQTSMTRTGFAVGTPSYMAPEQVLGKQVNHLSDVYSFGILLFELITGTKPLGGDSVERVFWQILNTPVDLGPLRTSGAPEPLVELIGRCTEKDPLCRPNSFTVVREALEAVQRGSVPVRPLVPTMVTPPPVLTVPPVSAVTPEVQTPPPPASTSRKWMLPAGAILAVSLAAGGYLAFRPHAPAPAPVVSPPSTTRTPPPASLSLASGDMVLVTAGTFLFGENKTPRDTPAYYIDRTEVTNRAYGEFLKSTGYGGPPGFAAARPAFPVVNMTMQDAREFARWANKRLPTAVEWEKAARGVDGRKYPWGDDPDPSLAAVDGAALRAADVETGKSPYGAEQMSGNVFEWVDEKMAPNVAGFLKNMRADARLSPKPTDGEPWTQIRGGSHLEQLKIWPVYEFIRVPERFRAPDLGFRCVRDVK
jgi:serine/threonine protein kinase